ncbi:MAG: hypothetical protein P9L96_03925, partial [Candidatus Gygaella obscura]|nr:hypothetical protein [Candidatus Gygaella obscura]
MIRKPLFILLILCFVRSVFAASGVESTRIYNLDTAVSSTSYYRAVTDIDQLSYKGFDVVLPYGSQNYPTAATEENLTSDDATLDYMESVVGNYLGFTFKFKVAEPEEDITQLQFFVKGAYADNPPAGNLNFYVWNGASYITTGLSSDAFVNAHAVNNDSHTTIITDTSYIQNYIDSNGIVNWLLETSAVCNPLHCCSLVFALTKEKYELVCDTLGAASLTHPKIPGMPKMEYDHDEYIKLPCLAKDNNGLLKLSYVEAVSEVTFLDQSKLVVVDHPADIEIFPNEFHARFKPFPEFKIIAVDKFQAPLSVKGVDAADYLDQIKEIDGEVIPMQCSQVPGLVEPYEITIDLGDMSNAQVIQLFVNGYTNHLGYEQSMKKIKDLGLDIEAPVFEIPDAEGQWQVYIPAGSRVPLVLGLTDFSTKTYVYDFTEAFKNGDYRIRIKGTVDMRIDAIKINTHKEKRDIYVHDADLNSAELSFHGRPKSYQINLGRKEVYSYDYYDVDGDCQNNIAKGAYTRYGDVASLLQEADDKFVVMTTGDELALGFSDKDVPDLKPGYKRSYLLYSNGYYKRFIFPDNPSNKVGQLPFSGMSTYPYPATESYPDSKTYQDYIENYNTRIATEDTHHSMYVDYVTMTVNYDQDPNVAINTTLGGTSQSGNVSVAYTLTDADLGSGTDTDTSSITAEYSIDSGVSWSAATEAAVGSDGTTGLNAESTGTTHTFIWASATDITDSSSNAAQFRITPQDEDKTTAATAVDNGTDFTVDNEKPTFSGGSYAHSDASLTLMFSEDIDVTP